MSSPSDMSKCVASSSSSDMKEEAEISSNKKVSTSCDQKVESCNNDGVSNNTTSNSSSGIDTISDSLGRVDISNDDDDKLFQDPPPKEDCPICLLPMPHENGVCGVRITYMPCCGKTLCCGCMFAANKEIVKGNIKDWCACCRTPLPENDKELTKRYYKRMELNDANAFCNLGMHYRHGSMAGLSTDFNKAIEMWKHAAELGSCSARAKIAGAYIIGVM